MSSIRTILGIVIIILVLSTNCSAQPTLKDHTIGQCLASNMALTFGSACGGSSVVGTTLNTTGSSLLVCIPMVFAWVSGGACTDNKGNSWTCIPATPHAAGNFNVQLCYAIPTTTSQIGTGHAFTIGAAGTSTFVSGAIMAFVGTQATTALRSMTESGGQANANLSVTPVAANDVLISGFSDDNGATLSINGGFTIVDTARTTANGETGGSAWQAAPNTSTITFTWTGNTAGVQNVVAFEVGPAPSGGGGAILQGVIGGGVVY